MENVNPQEALARLAAKRAAAKSSKGPKKTEAQLCIEREAAKKTKSKAKKVHTSGPAMCHGPDISH